MKKYKLLMLTTILVIASGLDAKPPTENPPLPAAAAASPVINNDPIDQPNIIEEDIIKRNAQYVTQIINELKKSDEVRDLISGRLSMALNALEALQGENTNLEQRLNESEQNSQQTSAEREQEISMLKKAKAALEASEKKLQEEKADLLTSMKNCIPTDDDKIKRTEREEREEKLSQRYLLLMQKKDGTNIEQ